jgi:hypothetical protein
MLHGKDGTEIDVMCLTMIYPASSWFEIVELPVVELSSMNNVFANCSEEDLTVKEIAKAQRLDRHLKATALKDKYEKTLIENTPVFCKNEKIVIPRHFSSVQLLGTTTIFSTLETHTSKKHSKLQCTGNKCIPLYVHMSKTLTKMWKTPC